MEEHPRSRMAHANWVVMRTRSKTVQSATESLFTCKLAWAVLQESTIYPNDHHIGGFIT